MCGWRLKLKARARLTANWQVLAISPWLFALASGCGSQSVTRPQPSPTEASNIPATNEPITLEKLSEKEPIPLTWEELEIPLPSEASLEDWMLTSRVKQLSGKRVRLAGFMSGTIFQLSNIKEFPLLREVECPFGKGGQAYHAVMVELDGKLRTSYTTRSLLVEGTFSIRPYQGPDGKTWAVYHLLGTKVELE